MQELEEADIGWQECFGHSAKASQLGSEEGEDPFCTVFVDFPSPPLSLAMIATLMEEAYLRQAGIASRRIGEDPTASGYNSERSVLHRLLGKVSHDVKDDLPGAR